MVYEALSQHQIVSVVVTKRIENLASVVKAI